MKIPSSFNLAGIPITTVYDNKMAAKCKVMGEARYQEQKILIDPTVAAQETIAQVFYHEAVHWILYVMNEDELRNNEKFVDTFAHFLFQMLSTSKFDKVAIESTEVKK